MNELRHPGTCFRLVSFRWATFSSRAKVGGPTSVLVAVMCVSSAFGLCGLPGEVATRLGGRVPVSVVCGVASAIGANLVAGCTMSVSGGEGVWGTKGSW